MWADTDVRNWHRADGLRHARPAARRAAAPVRQGLLPAPDRRGRRAQGGRRRPGHGARRAAAHQPVLPRAVGLHPAAGRRVRGPARRCSSRSRSSPATRSRSATSSTPSERAGIEGLGQVDLERRVHRNQELEGLSRMSFVILQAVMKRLEERRRARLFAELGSTMKLPRSGRGRLSLEVHELADHERPPMIRIPEYLEKRRRRAPATPTDVSRSAAAGADRARLVQGLADERRGRRARSPTAGSAPARATSRTSRRWPTAARARSSRSRPPAAGPWREADAHATRSGRADPRPLARARRRRAAVVEMADGVRACRLVAANERDAARRDEPRDGRRPARRARRGHPRHRARHRRQRDHGRRRRPAARPRAPTVSGRPRDGATSTASTRASSETRLRIACDVTNPLLGRAGAAATYGPQKGATPADVAGARHAAAPGFADALERATGRRERDTPGAGRRRRRRLRAARARRTASRSSRSGRASTS